MGFKKTRINKNNLINSYSVANQGNIKVEKELAKGLGIPVSEAVIYCPNEWVMKESAVLVKTSLGIHRLNEPRLNPPVDVKIFENQYENLWRLYVAFQKM